MIVAVHVMNNIIIHWYVWHHRLEHTHQYDIMNIHYAPPLYIQTGVHERLGHFNLILCFSGSTDPTFGENFC